MKIEKVITVNPLTTDGQVIEIGDEVIFNADDKCYIGTFQGMSKRGAVQLKGLIVGNEVVFNVMPSSIDVIYKTELLARESEEK